MVVSQQGYDAHIRDSEALGPKYTELAIYRGIFVNRFPHLRRSGQMIARGEVILAELQDILVRVSDAGASRVDTLPLAKARYFESMSVHINARTAVNGVGEELGVK